MKKGERKDFSFPPPQKYGKACICVRRKGIGVGWRGKCFQHSCFGGQSNSVRDRARPALDLHEKWGQEKQNGAWWFSFNARGSDVEVHFRQGSWGNALGNAEDPPSQPLIPETHSCLYKDIAKWSLASLGCSWQRKSSLHFPAIMVLPLTLLLSLCPLVCTSFSKFSPLPFPKPYGLEQGFLILLRLWTV